MPGPSADAARREARAAYEAGRSEEALEQLGKLADLGPLADDDRCLRGRVRLDLGAFDEGLADLATVPDGSTSGLEARLLEGQAQVRRGWLGAAESAFRRALALDPGSIRARRELVYILGMQLRREEQHEQFLALAELTDLDLKEAWIWCLTDNLVWWEPDEIAADYERFLAAEPGNAETRLAIAENSWRLAKPGDAESVLQPLGDDPRALAFLARLALERGDLSAAEALIARGSAAEPRLAHARGLLALHKGEAGAAVVALKIAREATPRRRAVLADLGRALRIAEAEEEAGPIQDRIRRLDAVATLLLRLEGYLRGGQGAEIPVDFLRSLAMAYEGLEEPEKAGTWYRIILMHDPLDGEAQRSLARLKAARPG